MSTKGRGRGAIAVCDVGTNTVLYLLMAPGPGGEPVVVEEAVAPTRLGEGLAGGEPSAAALARTVAALTAFVSRARAAGAAEVVVIGTEALRRPRWRRPFAAAASAELGLDVSVIPAEEEGALVMLAARRSLPLGPGPAVVVDVGGGSAQVVRERRGAPPEVGSYPLGCVLLTEKFLRSPADARRWQEARDYIRGELAGMTPAAGPVVVTGGTATTVAALEQRLDAYDAARVHGYGITAAAVGAWAQRVWAMPLAERRRLAGMPAARADVFPAGALVLAEVLAALDAERATVSARGVRFGVAYRYFDAEGVR